LQSNRENVQRFQASQRSQVIEQEIGKAERRFPELAGPVDFLAGFFGHRWRHGYMFVKTWEKASPSLGERWAQNIQGPKAPRRVSQRSTFNS
jgi:hypothetical protein